MSRSVRDPDYRSEQDARPESMQACATKITLRIQTGGPDVIGYCTMPLGHPGAHYIRTTN